MHTATIVHQHTLSPRSHQPKEYDLESESDENTRYYYKDELRGLVSTLKDLFNPGFRKMEKEFARHWKDVLQANPFLEEVFDPLKKEANWKQVLASAPREIEVKFLPTKEDSERNFQHVLDELLVRALNDDERTFLAADGRLWTLFISLPRECIQALDADTQLLWGAEMPNRFYFGENRNETEKRGVPQYELLGLEYPFR